MDMQAVWISIKTASVSIVITFFIGILAAYYIVRLKRETIKSVIDAILTLPLVLPPTVAGFFLLYIFGVNRPIGSFLLEFLSIKLVFNWQATVVAAVIISFPLMYRSARGAFEQIDENIINAARTIGMAEWDIFRRIMLPLAFPGIISGGILAFARGLGEFGTTAMIAGNIAGKTRTLPLAVYSAVAGGNFDSAYEYVFILLGISFLVIIGMNWFTFKERHYMGKGTKL